MNYAIILSGGTGTRLGNARPKQYITVANKPVIMYSIENSREIRMLIKS